MPASRVASWRWSALVVEGRSNDEIGAALGIGAKTVETHLARLFERFGIASRTELATRALREGWLDLPPADPAPQRGRVTNTPQPRYRRPQRRYVRAVVVEELAHRRRGPGRPGLAASQSAIVRHCEAS